MALEDADAGAEVGRMLFISEQQDRQHDPQGEHLENVSNELSYQTPNADQSYNVKQSSPPPPVV